MMQTYFETLLYENPPPNLMSAMFIIISEKDSDTNILLVNENHVPLISYLIQHLPKIVDDILKW